MIERSFAEILKEFTYGKTTTTSSFSAKDHFNTEKPTKEQISFEMSQLGLMQKMKPSFKSESSVRFKRPNAYTSSLPPKEKPISQKRSPLAKTKQRPKGLPHKLDSKQQESFAFFVNHFELLQDDFTNEELKKAFKRLCFKMHPDSPKGNHQSFIELKKNYDQLIKIFKLTP